MTTFFYTTNSLNFVTWVASYLHWSQGCLILKCTEFSCRFRLPRAAVRNAHLSQANCLFAGLCGRRRFTADVVVAGDMVDISTGSSLAVIALARDISDGEEPPGDAAE